jgi:hypothetical protein
MIEVLQFIFSSFWVWIGTVFLIATIGTSIAGIISSLKE